MPKRHTPQALKEHLRTPSAKDKRRGAASPKVPAVSHAPPAPAKLNKYGRAEWNRVAPIMVDVGMLTELDLAPLYAYADSFGLVHEIGEKMKPLAKQDPVTGAIVVTSPSGAAYLNPLYSARRSAIRDMVRYASELGLTPAGRAGLLQGPRGGTTKPKAPEGQALAEKFNL